MIINLKKIEKISVSPEWKYPHLDLIEKDGITNISFGSTNIGKIINNKITLNDPNEYLMINDDIHQAPFITIHFSNSSQNKISIPELLENITEQFEVILSEEISVLIKHDHQLVSSNEIVTRAIDIIKNLKKEYHD